MNSLINTRYTSLILKVTGIIFIISAFVDFITLAIPIKLFEPTWRLQFAGSLIDRGIVPLLGIVLFLVSFWFDGTVVKDTVDPKIAKKKKKSFDVRSLFYILAIIMGLGYLLLIPIYIRDVNSIRRVALFNINREFQQLETQSQNQYNQIKEVINTPNISDRIKQGLTQLEEFANSQQELSQEQQIQLEQQRQQLTNWQNYVNDPKKLDEDFNKAQTRLDTEKLARVTQTNLESFRQIARNSANSLLLAIAYSILGWLGLRNLLGAQRKTQPSVQ